MEAMPAVCCRQLQCGHEHHRRLPPHAADPYNPVWMTGELIVWWSGGFCCCMLDCLFGGFVFWLLGDLVDWNAGGLVEQRDQPEQPQQQEQPEQSEEAPRRFPGGFLRRL